MAFTLEEVKEKFYCSGGTCVICERTKGCNAYAAIEFKEFKKKRKKELDEKFFCREINTCCNRNCSKNKVCEEFVHKNYRKWKKAYGSNNKGVLIKLSEGEQ